MKEKVEAMRLRTVDPGPDREANLPMLLLADESEQQVRSYLQKGILYVASQDGEDVGVVQAIPFLLSSVELRAVAVIPEKRQRGLGREMLRRVLSDLNGRGYSRVTVGTGNSSIAQIAFYQKSGFRMWRIEQDYFSPEKGYPEGLEENGIPLRDMLWFERTS